MRRSLLSVVAIALFAGSVRAEESGLFETAAAVAEKNDDASWDRMLTVVQSLRTRIEKAAGSVPYSGIVDLQPIRKLSRASGKEQNLTSVRLGGRTARTGYISNSAVVIDGDLNDVSGYINDSVVIVKGNLSLTGYINNSIVFVDGSVDAMGYSQDSLVVSSQAGGLNFMGHVTRSIVVGDLTLVGYVKDVVLFGALAGIGVDQRGLVKKDAAPVYEWLTEAPDAAPPDTPTEPRSDGGKGDPGQKGEMPPLFQAVRQIVEKGTDSTWKTLVEDAAELADEIGEAAGDDAFAGVFDPTPLLGLPTSDQAGGGLEDCRYASRTAPQGRLNNCVVIVDGDFKSAAEYIKNCLIVVNGDMEIDGYIKDSIVIVRGRLSVKAYVKDMILVAGAGSENRFEYAKDAILVGDVAQANYVRDSVVFGEIVSGIDLKGVNTRDAKTLDLKAVRSAGPSK